jgi:hypothetical protein
MEMFQEEHPKLLKCNMDGRKGVSFARKKRQRNFRLAHTALAVRDHQAINFVGAEHCVVRHTDVTSHLLKGIYSCAGAGRL